jgi:predicted RNase H-like nuclease (RuvC/YqgF family)
VYTEMIDTKKEEIERLEVRVDSNAKAVTENEQLKKDKEELQKKTIEQEKEIEKLQDNAKRDLEMMELKLKNEHMQEINELNQKHIEQIQNEQKTLKKRQQHRKLTMRNQSKRENQNRKQNNFVYKDNMKIKRVYILYYQCVQGVYKEFICYIKSIQLNIVFLVQSNIQNRKKTLFFRAKLKL